MAFKNVENSLTLRTKPVRGSLPAPCWWSGLLPAGCPWVSFYVVTPSLRDAEMHPGHLSMQHPQAPASLAQPMKGGAGSQELWKMKVQATDWEKTLADPISSVGLVYSSAKRQQTCCKEAFGKYLRFTRPHRHCDRHSAVPLQHKGSHRHYLSKRHGCVPIKLLL